MKVSSSINRASLFISVLLVLSFTNINIAKAQFEDSGEILRSGTNDANLLMEEYMKPFAKGFGAGLNSGWVNTAAPHPTLGFDVKISLSFARVPTGDRSFIVDDLNFKKLERIEGPEISQTIFGSDRLGPIMGIFGTNPLTGERLELGRFNMPQGTGYPYVPAPLLQVTMGTVLDTDISVRYSPNVTFNHFSVRLFGIGARHGINQWLPAGIDLPFHISVQAGYTLLNSNYGLEVLPEQAIDIYNSYSIDPAIWNNQEVALKSSGLTSNLIIGKKLTFLSIYGGLGIQTSSINLSSPGNYPITISNPNYHPAISTEEYRERKIERIEDPISLSYSGSNIIHSFAGLNVRTSAFIASASIKYSNYAVLNIGLGVRY